MPIDIMLLCYFHCFALLEIKIYLLREDLALFRPYFRGEIMPASKRTVYFFLFPLA
jgi:hypothetical protein